MIDFKGSQFEREIILWGVRWYVAYPISYRQLEEMMGERGVGVDHSTLNRWVIKYAPEVEKVFRRLQRPVGRSWRLDETDLRIKGKWAYLYRAVDKAGQTLDFLLTPHRDRAAAAAFLHKAIRAHGLPEKITIDQSGSNTAASHHYTQVHKTAIVIHQSKYLNLSCHWSSESKSEQRQTDFEFKATARDCAQGACEQGGNLTEGGLDPHARIMAKVALHPRHRAFDSGIQVRLQENANS